MMKSLGKGMFPIVFALFLLLTTGGVAQAASGESVGYADFIYLVNQHP